jgi:hypothetical protein
MKTSRLLAFFALMITFSLAITSCKKWRDNRDTTIIKDQNVIEGLFDDMFKIVDQASRCRIGLVRILGSSAAFDGLSRTSQKDA